jgi:hypothetical protein
MLLRRHDKVRFARMEHCDLHIATLCNHNRNKETNKTKRTNKEPKQTKTNQTKRNQTNKAGIESRNHTLIFLNGV